MELGFWFVLTFLAGLAFGFAVALALRLDLMSNGRP